MTNKNALTRFEAFVREPKIIGEKQFYNKRTRLLVVGPNLILLTLAFIMFFLDYTNLGLLFLVILGLLWAGWYGPALDKSFKETVELGWWSIVHWLGNPILWLTSGSGFLFVLWPFGRYRMKQVLLNLPFSFNNISTGSAALAIYKSGAEREMFERDPLNYYRLPISLHGSIQLFPASIDFFDRIIEPSKWQKFVKSTRDEKEIEQFLKEEVAKQVWPEIQRGLAKIIGKKTPAQIIAASEEIETLIEGPLVLLIEKWGLQINAFQIAPLELVAEIWEVFNQTVVARLMKEVKTLEGEAQRVYIREQQMGWAEALEAIKDKAGVEIYTVYKNLETLQEGYKLGAASLKESDYSMLTGDLGQILSLFSPATKQMIEKLKIGPVKIG